MSSKVPIQSIKKLAEMHTGTLMSRRTKLLQCEETFWMSDFAVTEAKPDSAKTGMIEFKDTPEWKQAYADLKSLLANRENLPNRAERKAARQLKASRGRKR